MNEEQIKTLVDEAITLHRDIATKSDELKALKAKLVLHARSQPDELATTESGGKRWAAKGSDGSVARVSFPAPALIPELDAQCEKAKQAQSLAGDGFRRLFAPVKMYQLVDDFRALTRALLPTRKAEALLALCETESSPRVSFEVATRPAAELVEA